MIGQFYISIDIRKQNCNEKEQSKMTIIK